MTDARRWRRSLSPALCVVVAMSALGVDPVPAKAQMRRCAEHALQSTDQHRLLAVAQVALPAGIALEAPDVCRNPGHASAWLSTTHQASADTVTRWWTLICDRDQRLWICERPELHQQVERDVAIADHPIHLLIEFDQATSRDNAIHFATEALSIAIAPDSILAECLDPKAGAAEWRSARPPAQSLITSPQKITVSNEEGAVSVVLIGDFGLRFTPPVPGQTKPASPCWEQWITVT